MKKLIVLTLTLILAFCVTACGGPSVEDLPKEVVITIDNWDDYLEVKEIQTWKYDEAGKAEGVDDYVTVIALKDKYSSKVISEETVLDFEYTANVKEIMMTYDLEDLEVTFMDPPTGEAAAVEVMNTTAYDKIAAFKDLAPSTYEQVTKECQPVGLFLINPFGMKANVYEDIEITKAEGTLVFVE